MKTRNLAKFGGAVAVISLLTFSAGAVVVYNNPTGLTGLQNNGPWNLGLDFQVNTAGYVNKMGAYDDGLNGFEGTLPVALYYVSGFGALDGTQVLGTVVNLTGSPADVSGSSRLVSLTTPVLLQPGVYSVVGANFGNDGVGPGNPFKNAVTNPADATFNTVGGALTMLSWRDASGAALVFPTADVGGVGGQAYGTNPRWTAATFDFTPVPEAAHFALGGIGLLGLVYVGRYAHLRRKMKSA